MNKMMITGNLVRDPVQYRTKSDIPYARFTVAVRKRSHREGEPDSDFIRVTAWRGLGDTCMKYLTKGRKVGVIGSADVSCYTGTDNKPHASLEITADEVEFLSSAGGQSAEKPEEPPQMEPVEPDEDFPFA
ncbi:MAG: single-stranded DNA-binding protein [Clostridia bacterium]|nr:single-stranded DNA-binding protein [Clostridia bacterium]